MSHFKNDILNCLQILRSGGIILYPTDTIWGIGCDATNMPAVQKIYQLKKREEKKSMIILVIDKQMIADYVIDPSEKILSFLSAEKKPTTGIFEKAVNLPPQLINADGTIAVRIVRDDFCRQLIHQLQRPLISTSANISGEPYPRNYPEISEAIKSGVDYIARHRQNDLEISAPSAIIKLGSNNEITYIRP